MYTTLKISLIASILLSTLIFSNDIVAKDCYEKSPNLISLKDKYYDIDVIKKLSDDDKTKLNTLFDKIEGKWKGESSYSECKGPDRAPKIVSKSFTIESSIKLDSNSNLIISAKKSYSNNVTKREVITLLGNLRIFELKLSKNTLIFSERARLRNVNKSSRMVETIYEITLNSNSLIFIRSYYSNGVFVAEEKWSMN